MVFDLGANIGTFALYVLSRHSDARVYSVEPAAETFEVLLRNRDLNSACRWEVIRGAVWPVNGNASLKHGGTSTGNRVTVGEGDECVPALTLASLLAQSGQRRIDLMKMDIEGAEGDILPVAAEVLRNVDNLAVEIHNDRIDERNVASVLEASFPYRYRIGPRKSTKPLVLAAHVRLDLQPYRMGIATSS